MNEARRGTRWKIPREVNTPHEKTRLKTEKASHTPRERNEREKREKREGLKRWLKFTREEEGRGRWTYRFRAAPKRSVRPGLKLEPRKPDRRDSSIPGVKLSS